MFQLDQMRTNSEGCPTESGLLIAGLLACPRSFVLAAAAEYSVPFSRDGSPA